MTEIITYGLGVFINVALAYALCYTPFWNDLRITHKQLMMFMAFFGLLHLSTTYFVIFFIPHWQNWTQLHSLIFLFIYLITYILTVKESIFKLIYVVLTVKVYGDCINILSKFMEINLYPENKGTVYRINFIVIELIFFLFTYWTMWLLFKKMRLLMDYNNDRIWTIMWLIPFIFIIISQTAVLGLNSSLINTIQCFILISSILAGSYIINYIVLWMLRQTHENARLQEAMKFTTNQIELQAEQYRMMEKNITDMKKAKHDLRHHLSLIQSYLENGDRQKLQAYIDQYKITLPEHTETILCLNYTIDVIVRHYTNIAKADGIDVSVKLNIPDKTGILDTDLCILFGNTIENAFEACQRMKKEEMRFIKIRAKQTQSIITITIDNSYNGNLKQKDGIYLSDKRNNKEGIGLSSIRAVAEKYNGFVELSQSNHIFKTAIMLCPKEAK